MSEKLRGGSPLDDAEIARLYQESATEEPPTALDDAIRAAARREAGSGPRRIGSPFSRSWVVPASAAAVLVLGVGLVSVMQHSAPELASPAAPATLATKKEASGAGMIGQVTNLAERREPPADAEAQAAEQPPVASPAESLAVRSLDQPSAEPSRQKSLRTAATPAPVAVEEAVREQDEDAGAADERLLRIRTLLDENRNAEALDAWIEFRERYPDYSVDADLSERLEALEKEIGER